MLANDKSILKFYLTASSIVNALIVVMLICSVAHAEVYDEDIIANAIYKAEGGTKAKKPYGILSVACEGEAHCRRICINTIRNNFVRYQIDNKGYKDFIEFLASRYAPVGAGNDPTNLNINWIKNVRYFINKEGLK